MPKFTLSQQEIHLLCGALEEFYDNLQYEEITDEEVRDAQISISKLVAKLLKHEEAVHG